MSFVEDDNSVVSTVTKQEPALVALKFHADVPIICPAYLKRRVSSVLIEHLTHSVTSIVRNK